MSSAAELIATLESIAVGDSCFHILASKSPATCAASVERNRAAIAAVQKIIEERDALRASLLSIHSAAIHHFSSCHPGPFKRMPPELRAAIAAATAPTQDKANDQQAE